MRQEKNRSIIYVTIFIALIMVLSVIGFLWGGSGKEQYRYGKFSFSYENGEWKTNLGGKQLAFKHLPYETLNITVPEGAKSYLSNARMVYISYDPSENREELALVQFNLGKNLETMGRFVVNALSTENQNNAPVITCQNSTQAVPVIIIKKNRDFDSISLNNSCIILEGNPTLVADRLVCSLYGITD
jgi:hypothetical protein